LEFRLWGLRYREKGLGRVLGFRFRVKGLGYKVQVLGLKN
jgi:hypothetical protein